MMSLMRSWINRGAKTERSPYIAAVLSGLEWMLPVVEAEGRHDLEKMLSQR